MCRLLPLRIGRGRTSPGEVPALPGWDGSRVGKLRQAGCVPAPAKLGTGPAARAWGGCETSAGTAASSPAEHIRPRWERRGAPVGFLRVPPPGSLKKKPQNQQKHQKPTKTPKPQAAFWPGSKEKFADGLCVGARCSQTRARGRNTLNICFIKHQEERGSRPLSALGEGGSSPRGHCSFFQIPGDFGVF